MIPRRPDGAATRRRGGAESGETLVEVIVTVAILGLGVVALLSGLFTLTKTSSIDNLRTQASISVQAWAEDLQQPAIAVPAVTAPGFSRYLYVGCAIPATYSGPPPNTLPAGWTATITQIRYLTGYSGSPPQPQFTSNVNTCYTNGDKGVQEITLLIDSNTNTPRSRDTLVVYRRDQGCPTSYDNADLGPC